MVKFISTNYSTRSNVKTGSLSKNGNSKAPAPERKYASSDVTYTQPSFYSPLHTPQNWQVPSKKTEVYMWARYFYENEPKVAAAIDFYSQFPMQDFELQVSDPKVKRHFDKLNKRLNFSYWLPIISSEYFLLGDVYPFLSFECGKCHGMGALENGEPCSHKGGTFKNMQILNPDWVQVDDNIMGGEEVIKLIPDDNLKKIVQQKYPEEIYNTIPPIVKNSVLQGIPIVLSNRSVFHLKYQPSGYAPYGTSMVRRMFKVLAYKDRLMTANWIIAERLILPVRIVKIGNEERPAGAQDIADV